MKHKGQIHAGKRAAGVFTPKAKMENKTRPAASVYAMMEAIQMRADYLGPVLEEIRRTGQARAGWAISV